MTKCYNYDSMFNDCIAIWGKFFTCCSVHQSIFPQLLQRTSFQQTVAVFGKVDIVCNNAGVCNEANWRKNIEIDLVSDIIMQHSLACYYLCLIG